MTELMDPPAAPANGNQLTRRESETQLARAPVNPAFQSRGIVLTSFADAWKMACAVHQSGLAPTGFKSAESVLIAIQMGMEVGLPPMAAVRSIAVINGKPAIYGDAALALVRASGLLEEFEERIEGSGETRTAVCVVKRKGMKPRTTRFSLADAKRAQLTGKTGPWTQYPERMLQFRARGFALRDEFGDVLQGMTTAEEVADYGAVPAVTDAPARGVAGLLQRVTSRPVSEGQTFEPDPDAVARETAADAAGPGGPAIRTDEDPAGAPIDDKPEPDVSGEGAEPPEDVAITEALGQDVDGYRRVLIDALAKRMGGATTAATQAVVGWIKLNAPKGDANAIHPDRRRELWDSIQDGRAYVKDGRMMFRATNV